MMSRVKRCENKFCEGSPEFYE